MLPILTAPLQASLESAQPLSVARRYSAEGYDVPGEQGISVLGKAASYEAALRLIDVLRLA